MDIVNPKVFRDASAFKESFQNAEPFRHVVIDDFFSTEILGKLIEEFPKFEDRKNLVSDAGKKGAMKGGKSNVKDFGPAFRLFDEFTSGPAFLGLIEEITGIPDLLYDPMYAGAGIHENFSGPRNMIHVDFNHHSSTGYHRRLNAIVYITEDWMEEWGGALKIYKDGWNPDETVKRKLPCLFNRCVLFETNEVSWHGVESIDIPDNKTSRKSITIYLYTKERPKEEIEVAHQTVYVPGDLPKFVLEQSKEVSLVQYESLSGYLHSQKQLLKRLYERELEFSHKINKQQEIIDRLKSKYRLPVVGQGIVTPVSGLENCNDWIIEEAVLGLKTVRSISNFYVEGFCPVEPGLRISLFYNDQLIHESDIESGKLFKVWASLKLNGGDDGQIRLVCKTSNHNNTTMLNVEPKFKLISIALE